MERLTALRAEMKERGISAVIIPSTDPHQSEYTAAHWQARQWITGFTGSAGTAVVTLSRALLWTDFRYWIQAREQMDDFELFRQGEDGVPEFDAWLGDTLSPGDRIALDGKLVSAARAKKYRAGFEEKGICLDTSLDLVSEVWSDRPPLPVSPAFVFETVFAGKSRTEKLDEIRGKMAESGARIHLMTALDEIAWTFNLRGNDVHTTPVNLAFALISLGGASLFVQPDKLDQKVRDELARDGIGLGAYGEIDGALAGLETGNTILVNPETVSDHLYRSVADGVKKIEKPNPAAGLKCLKNKIEINHMRDTAVKDGRAVVNFFHWLAHETGPVTELSAAEKMSEFRELQDDFMDASFDAIMAFKDHSAMCHYSATQKSDVRLIPDAMFLSDSGGNYLTGTTDITRTVHLGCPGNQEIRDYTLVLKGHIAVATARFPSGTRGYQIDTLARQFLWQQGMDFGHGTGHGVGFFLCVHEGPARISPHPVDERLKPGMLLTNEPGLYREGEYGIRLENMVLVIQDRENEFGRFMAFENMTLCHFERELMDRELLTDAEISWINDYHREVYEKLAPGLLPGVREWLRKKTLPL